MPATPAATCPPIMFVSSISATDAPRRAAWMAAMIPLVPAPTTITS
jgi:hypothetical protein